MTHLHHSRPKSRRRPPAQPEQIAFRRRVIVTLVAILAPAMLVVVAGLVLMWPHKSAGDVDLGATGFTPGTVFVSATVVSVKPFQCQGVGSAPGPDGKVSTVTCAHVDVRVTSGPHRGQRAQVDLDPPTVRSGVHAGDPLSLAGFANAPGQPTSYTFVDFERSTPMLWLAVAFAVLVIAVARLRGLAALVGLTLSFIVLVKFMIPALLSGASPLLVGLIGSAAIMFLVLYLAHGISIRTTTALIGTLFGLASSALLGAWAVGAAHLSGIASEDDLTVSAVASQVRLSGLLLCGIVVASLGILNDVTVTQASAVWELHDLRPDSSGRRLFGGAMRIGRDHIASTVYTIAFAYAGAALPVLLLIDISQQPLTTVLTREALAEEVIRILVGSIGLVLSVPLTTAVGVLLVRASRPTSSAVEPPVTPGPPDVAPASRQPSDLTQVLAHYGDRRPNRDS